ncbi:MAG: BamA/TamA family outer membrane protein [Balneolaceae bacterium]
MRRLFISILFLPLLILVTESGYSQNNQQEDELSETEESDVIRKVRFTGNTNVSDRVLSTLVRTRTNREFLGIPRFTPWYYFWQVFGVGESPSELDREIIANDIDRISIYYENIGFFDVAVDTTIIEYKKTRYEISFLITEGDQSTIQTVSYTGLPDFKDESQRVDFYNESRFRSEQINDSTFLYNRSYAVRELREEQSRIINFLKDRGYAAVQRDSVRALLKRNPDNQTEIDVLFTVRHGNFYNFGNLYITMQGPDGDDGYDDSVELSGEPYTREGYSISMQKQNSAQSRFDLLSEQIQFTPGEPFNQSAYLSTINSYQNLGNLIISRFGLSENSSLPDYSVTEIPVYFDLQTQPKHSLRAEFFGMRRYGFGTGIGTNYNNNNVFGKSENFTLGVNTNLEYVPSTTLNEIAPRDTLGRRTSSGAAIFQSYELRAEYSVPRLNFPFSSLTDSPYIESARTRYSLTYSQSNQLFFNINSDIRFNLRYEFRHSQRLTSFLDILELDIVDTTPSSQFRQNLINEFGEGSFELLRIEQDFNPQFSSIVRYTFRDMNTNLIKRDYGYFGEVSIALAGNIPYLLDRFVITPGDLEQTLPSPFGISTNNLAYSRFIKFSADYRRYVPLSPNTIFAFRLFGGFAQPIGDSRSIPLNRRYFAGGSNDIRGWNPFRLGPGSISPDEVSIPGGEIKLAIFKEFRQVVVRDVFGAAWHLAWHTDAGNVWYGPKNSFLDEDDQDLLRDGKFFLDSFYKQLAVGSGFGLRLDWEFIVARFDATFRIHDLEQGWFENRLLYFSFGIGHSF